MGKHLGLGAVGVFLLFGCAAHAPAEVRRSSEPAIPSISSSRTTTPSRAEPRSSALTPERAVRFRRVLELRFSPNGSRLACVVSEAKGAAVETHIWMADVRSGDIHPFTDSPKSERAPRWAPDGRSLAFLSSRGGEMQVHVMPADGGEAREITSHEGGVSDFRWAPDGKSMAFIAYEPDANRKPDAPQVADRPQDVPRLWTVDLASKTTRPITRDSLRIDEFDVAGPGHLLAIASEQPKSETWNTAIYDIAMADGTTRLLTRPAPPFSDLLSSPSGTRFATVRTRDRGPIGHDLFVQSASGHEEARNATAKIDRAVRNARWQNDAVVVARVANGFRNTLHRIDLRGASTPIELPHSAAVFDVARDGTIAFAGVDFDRQAEVYVKPTAGPIRQLGHLQEGWDDTPLSSAEVFRFQSFDGRSVEAALMKPPPSAPKSAEKSPLVLLVHGGPNSNFSAMYYWFGAWAQLLAARGYQVLMVNPRGSTGYGEDFMKANRGDWGGGDFKDLLAALDTVLARGEVDPERLGIAGWSYGAEMAQWAIGHTPRFKAAVSGAGVFDQFAEFGTQTDPTTDEWHFGTPWEQPETFLRNSPFAFIRNAKTPTLILHGDADRNNPVGQSKALYRALKRLGVETELVIYPGEPHGPRKVKNQIDILERMVRWFDTHLSSRLASP
ncbi:S9 family peptidase [Pendulispora rubella]|uniref:S9 family peptidase n=1 Tax=Pendulispora rubella TaxID=2741070 RepID=A0ABZ2LAD3_9BACT